MDYFVPKSLSEAEKLKKQSARAFYLAGGTILNWKGSPRAERLIDLKALKLEGIKKLKKGVEIGAMTTIQEIAESGDVPASLAGASALFTSRNVRNMATVGGNIAGKFFISNILPILVCYKAKVKYFSNGKKKTVSLDKWLSENEGIIVSVIIENPDRIVKFREEKVAASDFLSVFTSVGYLIAGGRIRDAEISLSGIHRRLFISKEAVKFLNGKKQREIFVSALNEIVQKEIKPIGDVKVSKEVKRRIVEEHIINILSEIKGETR
ncbi:MAG: FAD binding domain-containing protein [Elusimicrobia bacterium]|nr:FAD binding domain-containing protein [Elusimicrobiota bacterium]